MFIYFFETILISDELLTINDLKTKTDGADFCILVGLFQIKKL